MKIKYSLLFLLAATINLSFAQKTRKVIQKVAIEKEFSAYLFVYFTGNSQDQEAVHYAVSTNGFNYFALNNNKPVLDSRKISHTGGIRDPHILRSEDGKTFYMALTDMTSSKGWDSNRGIVLLKSTDLINWTSTAINFLSAYPGNDNLKRVWAPETIFDAKAGKYMVYFSMKHGVEHDKIYYAYCNSEFTGLESEPKLLFEPHPPAACIDGNIIMKEGVYHLFYKTENQTAGIKSATAKDLTAGKWTENDRYLQQTSESVEGSGIFKINNSDTYIMMYDMYMKDRYQFTKSTNLIDFSLIDNEMTMDFKPRHGAVISITRKELKAVLKKWGKSSTKDLLLKK